MAQVKTLIGNVKGPQGDTPRIGDNGNWWIGNVDTGISASGVAGSGIAIGPDEPTDTDMWVDTDDDGDGEYGVVMSFNGRDGDVVPKIGDYTAEMVGAAEKLHASQHATGGSDPITPADIGAISSADRAKPSGIATLGTDGKLLDTQIPSLDKLGAAPAPVRSNMTLYVRATGNDNGGDGSEANPYATLKKALEALPKNLGGFTITIDIGNGSFDGADIKGFYSGELVIEGKGKTDDGTEIANVGLLVSRCHAKVSLKNMHVTGNRSGYNVWGAKSGIVTLVDIRCHGTNTPGGIFMSSVSTAELLRVNISDKTNFAFGVCGGTAYIKGLSGKNTGVGIMAGNEAQGISGLVICSSVTMTAGTLYSKVLGGVIIADNALQ